MKKNIIKSFFLLSVAFLASCNNDFSVDTPKIAAVEPVDIVATQKPVDNCSFFNNGLEYDLSLVTATDVTIYYKIQSSADAAPTSDELLASATKVAMTANEELIISKSELPSNTSYTLYAISVNADGLRSEEVYKKVYTTQVYDASAIITSVESDFSAALTNNSFKTTPVFSNDDRAYGTDVPVIVTKVSADTYEFNTIWGDFYKTLTNGNTTRPYPATIKINPDFTVTITYNSALAPYARRSSGIYDPCTKRLELTINWGSPTNPNSALFPPVYVTTTL
jgi:hypothetical protein